MNLDTLIIFVIVVVVVLGKVIRKFAEQLSQQANVQKADVAQYAASPEEVREFLRSIEGTEQPGPAPEAVQPEPEAGPRTTLAPRPEAGASLAVAKPGRTGERAAPAAGEPRRLVPDLPDAAAAAAPVAGLAQVYALRGRSLRRAVVWSEILGRPVSLREGRRLPPALRR